MFQSLFKLSNGRSGSDHARDYNPRPVELRGSWCFLFRMGGGALPVQGQFAELSKAFSSWVTMFSIIATEPAPRRPEEGSPELWALRAA